MKFNTLIKTLLLVTICTAGKVAQSRDSIWVENKQITFKEGRISIDLGFPQLDSERGNEPLLAAVNHSVMGSLVANLPIDSKIKVQTLDQLRLSLTTQITQIEQKARATPGLDAVPFELYSTWSAFSNKNIVSIYIERYFFMGGAYGKTQCTYLNFDTRTAEPIDVRSLIPDTTAFLNLVGELFCKDRRLPKNALQLQTGLFYDLTDLPMPRQMGFSDKGLVVIYNPLEIAPHSFGPISVTIPSKIFASKYPGILDKVNYRKGGKKSFDANTSRRNANLQRK